MGSTEINQTSYQKQFHTKRRKQMSHHATIPGKLYTNRIEWEPKMLPYYPWQGNGEIETNKMLVVKRFPCSRPPSDSALFDEGCHSHKSSLARTTLHRKYRAFMRVVTRRAILPIIGRRSDNSVGRDVCSH